MKKMTILLAALLFAVTGAYASAESDKETVRTVSLSGQVVDSSTGEALAGVKVEIDGIHQEIYTDFDGHFNIEGLIPGTYCVNTSLISYQKVERHIDLDHAGRIQLRLQQVTE